MKKNGLIVAFLMAGLFIISANTAQAYTYAISGAWDAGSYAAIGNTQRGQLSNALGASDSISFLSLGIGGAAVFDFGVEFDTAAIIFETTGYDRSTYIESADIYVSDSLSGLTLGTGISGNAVISNELISSFMKVGNITNSASTVIDLSALTGTFRYILIVDTSEAISNLRDGFDIDAIGVTPASTSAVPEPASVLLLGCGLIGVAALGKKNLKKA